MGTDLYVLNTCLLCSFSGVNKKISLWRKCRKSWVLLGSIPALGEKKIVSFNISIYVISLPYSFSEQIFLQSPRSFVCLLRDFSVAVDIKQ